MREPTLGSIGNDRARKTIRLDGRRFGRWLVVGPSRSQRFGALGKPKIQWFCRCDCGAERWVFSDVLRRGGSLSCGCLCREISRSRGTHYMSKTPIYRVWRSMISRCENSNNSQFHLYGGRGVTVCRRWRESFAAFRDDMGQKPTSSHSLDRIDNNGNYEPGNVRWATAKEQAANLRKNVNLTHDGETLCVSAWARKTGLREQTLRRRLSLGWSHEKALTTPADDSCRNSLTKTPSVLLSPERDVRREDSP
jgi:hypothetical protein